MAEMHGELMEFQETLQRQLVARDNQISRMKQELVSLRGPLPQDLEGTETVQDSSQSLCARNRPLINIWIPSVFLKGKGTDAHHLYQVGLYLFLLSCCLCVFLSPQTFPYSKTMQSK